MPARPALTLVARSRPPAASEEGGLPTLPPAAPVPVIQRLAAGQSLRFYAEAGTVLHVQSGRGAWIGAPQWQAEQYCRVRHSLSPGMVRVVSYAGWQTLAADAGGRLVVSVRLAEAVSLTRQGTVGLARLGAWLRRCLGRHDPAVVPVPPQGITPR